MGFFSLFLRAFRAFFFFLIFLFLRIVGLPPVPTVLSGAMPFAGSAFPHCTWLESRHRCDRQLPWRGKKPGSVCVLDLEPPPPPWPAAASNGPAQRSSTRLASCWHWKAIMCSLCPCAWSPAVRTWFHVAIDGCVVSFSCLLMRFCCLFPPCRVIFWGVGAHTISGTGH